MERDPKASWAASGSEETQHGTMVYTDGDISIKPITLIINSVLFLKSWFWSARGDGIRFSSEGKSGKGNI